MTDDTPKEGGGVTGGSTTAGGATGQQASNVTGNVRQMTVGDLVDLANQLNLDISPVVDLLNDMKLDVSPDIGISGTGNVGAQE